MKNNTRALLLAFFCFGVAVLLMPLSARSDQRGVRQTEKRDTRTEGCAPCREFNKLNSSVRDGKIGKEAAKARVRELLPAVKSWYDARSRGYGKSEWVFPVEGYGSAVIGGSNGSCYVQGGYSYYDGNRHTGHPSYDIFIRDSNQDGLDDATGKPVRVLSLTGGVVVAAERDWDSRSDLRGGKYLWIYDPHTDSLVYYAHNSELSVSVGDLVKPGDRIALVGRTGLNAFKKRSPTHLHLTYLEVRDGKLTPERIYAELVRSGAGASKQKP
jgi:hypothetical protein